MKKNKTELDKEVSDEEFQAKKIHYLNSELQVDLEFNKSLMNLCGGGLVISVTLMQFFLNEGDLILKGFLFTSWTLLLIATILCLFFFKIAHNSLKYRHQKLEYMYNYKPADRYDEVFKKIRRESIREALGDIAWNEKMKNRLGFFLSFLGNYFSFITSSLFIFGILSLLIFVSSNL